VKKYQKSEKKASVPHHKLLWRNGELVALRYAKPEHMLRKPPAWSYHVKVVEAMKKAGVDLLEVVFGDKVFTCSLQRFLRYAAKLDRGCGEQLFLPLSYWDTRKKQNAEEKRHAQLPLFA
jgi:hypothetical protein